MKIVAKEWREAISKRRSRRQFNDEAINNDIINQLTDFQDTLNEYVDGAKVLFVNEVPDKIFKGAVGSYGKIKNAPAYVAFAGNMKDPNVQEKVGYLGECFILEATARGLATCWVGGFFREQTVNRHLNIAGEEKVLAVSPVGYTREDYSFEEKMMSGFAKSHKRLDLEKLCPNNDIESFPSWLRSALEAARLAPSAVNRQPWRFFIGENTIKISLDSPKDNYHISKRLDCGIAMLHLEVEANYHGINGQWEYLKKPDVALFTF